MGTKRTSLINFRISDKERRALEVMATLENRSISEMMREALREAAQKRGFKTIGLVNPAVGEVAITNQ